MRLIITTKKMFFLSAGCKEILNENIFNLTEGMN